MVPFEVVREVQHSRWEYNHRCIMRCLATQRPVRGTHAGFCDLFVPLAVQGRVEAALMAGPFAISYPTSHEITQRWSTIGHPRASLSDPTFVRYLSASLRVLTLKGSLVDVFEKLLVRFGQALSDAPDSARLAEECEALSHELAEARAVERLWEMTRSLIDDRTSREWAGAVMRDPLLRMGLKAPPRHALVGLVRERGQETDPIDEALRRHALQRGLTELARRRQNAVCGQVGSHGAVLLACDAGNRNRVALERLASEATELARRLGLRLHVGVALGRPRSALPDVYRAALAAAERGLSREVPLSFTEGREPSSRTALSSLRASLADSVSAGSVV
ncbi:MAG TPA: hypothetical protein VGP93_20535, partial [Polyangiaceae bacterium]|nr:hypothetical protein [Polyangiaceae bacterium]